MAGGCQRLLTLCAIAAASSAVGWELRDRRLPGRLVDWRADAPQRVAWVVHVLEGRADARTSLTAGRG